MANGLTDAVTDMGRDAPVDTETQVALDRARLVARLLDDAVRVPGTGFRVGLDPLLGVAPVSGDLLAAIGSLYIVFQGVQAGVSRRTAVRMLLRVGVDVTVGSIPVLGTLFDFGWKANERNVADIETHLGA